MWDNFWYVDLLQAVGFAWVCIYLDIHISGSACNVSAWSKIPRDIGRLFTNFDRV